MTEIKHKCSTQINYKKQIALFKCPFCSYKACYDNQKDEFFVLDKGNDSVQHTSEYTKLLAVPKFKKQ